MSCLQGRADRVITSATPCHPFFDIKEASPPLNSLILFGPTPAMQSVDDGASSAVCMPAWWSRRQPREEAVGSKHVVASSYSRLRCRTTQSTHNVDESDPFNLCKMLSLDYHSSTRSPANTKFAGVDGQRASFPAMWDASSPGCRCMAAVLQNVQRDAFRQGPFLSAGVVFR